MTATVSKSVPAESLEDSILRGLRAWQEKYPNGDGPRDRDLEGDIYSLLYVTLPGVAAVLPGVGWKANDPRGDYSCRFSSVLNEAFTRILDKCPTELLRKKSLRQLRGYVTKTMSNLMINHYRRKQTYNRIIDRFVGMSEVDQRAANPTLARIIQEKVAYFEDRTGVTYDKAVQQIEAWEASSDMEERTMAEAMQLRYVEGLGYIQIAKELEICKCREDVECMCKDEIKRMLKNGRDRLRKLKP